MPKNQILNQIRTTDLAQTCGPVLTASQCVTNKISECGIDQFDNPEVVAGLKYVRSGIIVANYICRDHVEVFNEHKECLLNPDSSNVPGLEVCGRPGPSRYRPFCIPRGFPGCVANNVETACGEEIASEFRTLGRQLLAEAGCPARKLFKMMKKEMYSPLELMDEVFPSFF